MPHRRSHGSEMSGLVPRPQRYGKWLCGGAALKPTVMRAVRSAGRRPGPPTGPGGFVCLTLTRRPIRRPGGSPVSLATRAGASWSTLAKRTPRVRVGATRRGRTNPTRRSPVCMSAKRTQATSATASEYRRTNPRQCNPTNIGLAKRTQRCVNLATPSWPNEPKPRTAAGTRPFWPSEPKPKQTVSVVAKWKRRDATAQMLS